MDQQSAEFETACATATAVAEAAFRSDRAERQCSRPVLEFLKTAFLFSLGVLIAILFCDWRIGRHFYHMHGEDLIGTDVYHGINRANTLAPSVRTVYLGDSVAHQLFMPGTEPSPEVRFLTTNQAISMAGQFYLLESAFQRDPSIHTVYFFYIPGCFANNLPPRLSHDYFCGYFHRLDEVVEIFRLKRDSQLTASHLGRWLMPHLMMANSMWNRGNDEAPDLTTPATPIAQSAPDPEPVLALLDHWFGKIPDGPEAPAGSYGQSLPVISNYFLTKMRALCVAHGATLHVLPCPLSTREHFEDSQHVFERGPMRVDPAMLIDAVHFKGHYIEQERRKVIGFYHLPLDPNIVARR
ncbi:MAG TPA: hypothetical protein VFW23_15035 [Tepidisphaeraceae bacterium]|nr:hypothetical protein [Tepidisphaeraceae bacterium]